MLDIELIRKSPDTVRRGLRARGSDLDVDDFLRLDASWRELRHRLDDLRARHNAASKEIGTLFQQGRREEAEGRKAEVREMSEEISRSESELRAIEEERASSLLIFPNLPEDSVPVGPDESANRKEREWGRPREFAFEPRAHWDIGGSLGILDLPRAAKLAGARFPLLRGEGARLERALAAFMLDLHTREHGYTEVSPPCMVVPEALTGTGQLPKFEEDLFRVEPGGRYLIPTAEVPLTNIPAGEILDDDALPMLLCANTLCFRAEAGAHGRDTRGIIRVHQFPKVELVHITRPEESWDHLEDLTRHAEEVLRRLEIPYRVVTLSTGDMGFSAAKTYDIEVWLPGQQAWREISSCSNCKAFQARRAAIRYRPRPDASPVHVHTLNGSGLAVGRTWIAVLENYQREDGGVDVPVALRPWMDGKEAILPREAG